MMNRPTGLHLLFAIQFLLVASRMFIDVKVGLSALICTFACLFVTLIQLSRDEQTEWNIGWNGMIGLCSLWTIFCLFEVLNPNNVMEAWNICISPYALLPLVCAFLVPLVIRDVKGIEWLLFIWSAFILIAAFKGYWQKSHGFTEKERYFLYALGGWRTHLIWSGIRYFSCFTDASTYGTHSAMAAVTFAISSFYIKVKWKRIYFLGIAFCAIYSLGISGTRSAMAVIVTGLLMMALISKSWKAMLLSGVSVSALFCFFYFTEIGNSNPYIYKMRSTFHPMEDASYMTRLENRKEMKILMSDKPFGYGIGLSKSERFQPRESMPYPPDSWLVSVWVETGIFGLCLYLSVFGTLFVWCTWILIFKVKDKRLRGLVVAWLCMNAGFFVSSYASDTLQFPNQMPVYVGFALCFAAQHIDRRISKEQENEIPESK